MTRPLRIDFIAPPFSGHLNPLIELAQGLDTSRYQIRFITGPAKKPLLTRLGFHTESILNHQPNAMEEIANTDKPVKSNPISMMVQLRENLTLFPLIVQEIEALLANNQTDMVVADFVAVPAGIACDRLNLHWITTIPTPFAIETKHGIPGYMGGLQPATGKWHGAFSVVHHLAGRYITRFFKLLVGVIFSKRLKNIGFQIYRKDGSEGAYSPHSILALGMKELEFEREWPPQLIFAGPCCAPPEPNGPTSYSPVDGPAGGPPSFEQFQLTIFVTIGTHLSWGKKRLRSQLISLSKAYKNWLIIFSKGQSNDSKTMVARTLPNFYEYNYLAYSRIIPKSDIVIHHGGAGVVYNCIKYATPSLIIPHDYDQFDYCARMTYFKIGLRLESVCQKDIKTMIESAISLKPNLEYYSKMMSGYSPASILLSEINRLAGKKLKPRRYM